MSGRRARAGWWVAFGLVVVMSAALVSPAVGGPRFLTVGAAKKTYLAKKDAAKTYVKKSGAATTYLKRKGDTRVPVQPSSWIRLTTPANVSLVNRFHSSIVYSTVANNDDVDLFAPAYVVNPLGGTSYDVVGLEVCYEFADQAVDQGIVDRIVLHRAGGSNADPVDGGISNLFVDNTGRIDSACTTLTVSPRVPVLPGDSLGIGVRLDFPDANAQVYLGRGALILRPHAG